MEILKLYDEFYWFFSLVLLRFYQHVFINDLFPFYEVLQEYSDLFRLYLKTVDEKIGKLLKLMHQKKHGPKRIF